MVWLRFGVVAVIVIACRREPQYGFPPAMREAPPDVAAAPDPASDPAADPAALPPIEIQVEVTGTITEARPDPVTKQLVLTVQVGANQGVREDWRGEVVDANGARVGTFTIREIKPRTVTGTTTLAKDKLTGTRVRLRSATSGS